MAFHKLAQSTPLGTYIDIPDKLHFPTSCEAREGQVIKFWPME